MNRLTEENILALGLVPSNNIIQQSYGLVLLDQVLESDENSIHENTSYHYKALSISMCNDKGKGEYYLFFREGDTKNRHEDTVVCITCNLEYLEDLESFIHVCSLDK